MAWAQHRWALGRESRPAPSPHSGQRKEHMHTRVYAATKYAESERPNCRCHDLPMLWGASPRHVAGGKWSCSRRRRKSWQERAHGITPERYEEMLIAQGGTCAVCDSASTELLHVDHDHACCSTRTSCGKCVRGLVCGNCNRMLGLASDDPARLRTGAAYLERS